MTLQEFVELSKASGVRACAHSSCSSLLEWRRGCLPVLMGLHL